jgi:hypothetical protein
MTSGKFIADFIKTCAGSAVFFGLAIAYFQSNLMAYLKLHRRNRWDEITSFLSISGRRNSFRSIPYIFDSRDDDDQEIKSLKWKIRVCIFLIISSFASVFLIFTILGIFFPGKVLR